MSERSERSGPHGGPARAKVPAATRHDLTNDGRTKERP